MIALALTFLLQAGTASYKQPVKITSKQADYLADQAKAVRSNLRKTKKKLADLEKSKVDWRKGAIYWSLPGVDTYESVLRGSIEGAADEADRTKNFVVNVSEGSEQKEATEILFSDIRIRYEKLSKKLDDLTAESYPSVRNDTLDALEHNALVYEVVADAGAETFDLDVGSTPPQATVFFMRKGDPPNKHPDPTDTTIPNLVYAIWTVRAHEDGYRDQEKEHDPFRQKNHVIHFDLVKK